MKYISKQFHCSPILLESLARQIEEVDAVIGAIHWAPEFGFVETGKPFEHQTGYNQAICRQFQRYGWEKQPFLREKPRLIGDFRKGLVFVEVQFGNSSTLYRDYYKFQYGLSNGLLSLAVLIVPTTPSRFFPTRVKSVQNMAEYSLAETYFTVLPIGVPTLLIGLLPEN